MTAGTEKEEAEQLALAAPKDQSYIEGRQICKVIVVPERLVYCLCMMNTEVLQRTSFASWFNSGGSS